MLSLPGITYVGTHGLEILTATGETRSLLPAGAFTTVMARLRREIESTVAGRPGLLLEDKLNTLALHYRLAAKEDGELAVAQFLATVQTYQRRGVALEVLRGKKVVEVRPVGINKGKAIQSLLKQRDHTIFPLYLGDDVTDEDAFQVLNERGLTILVADPPRGTAAQYYLRHPEEVLSFLLRVLSLRQPPTPSG
jgi:trehalose 6-phosphate phosphatase